MRYSNEGLLNKAARMGQWRCVYVHHSHGSVDLWWPTSKYHIGHYTSQQSISALAGQYWQSPQCVCARICVCVCKDSALKRSKGLFVTYLYSTAILYWTLCIDVLHLPLQNNIGCVCSCMCVSERKTERQRKRERQRLWPCFRTIDAIHAVVIIHLPTEQHKKLMCNLITTLTAGQLLLWRFYRHWNVL